MVARSVSALARSSSSMTLAGTNPDVTDKAPAVGAVLLLQPPAGGVLVAEAHDRGINRVVAVPTPPASPCPSLRRRRRHPPPARQERAGGHRAGPVGRQPHLDERSTSRWSARAATSVGQSRIVRPGRGENPPQPGRSGETTRIPLVGEHVRGRRKIEAPLVRPWKYRVTDPSRSPRLVYASVRPSTRVIAVSRIENLPSNSRAPGSRSPRDLGHVGVGRLDGVWSLSVR